MNQYKFYIFPMTLIILFGFLGVLELLNQTTTVNANVKTIEFIAGETEELTITSRESSLAVLETTFFTVALTNDTGLPISNTEITLTHTPKVTITTTDLSTTNQNGILTGTLRASTFTGMISVTATANISDQPLSDTVTITVTAGAPDKIMIINPPSQIKTNSTTILTTTVQDAYDNFISDEEVSFTAKPFGDINPNATTDVNGVVTATLTTTSTTGAISVTATIADHPSISETKEIPVNPYQIFLSLIHKPFIPVITLIPSSTEIFADETVTITTTVQDQNNNFLSEQEVSFNTSSGNITPMTSTTDMSGTVTAILKLKSNFKGTETITAKVGSYFKTEEITVNPYPIPLPFTDNNWSYDGNQPEITFQDQLELVLGNNNPDDCINGLPFPGKWKITSREIIVPVGVSKAIIDVKFEGFTFDRNIPLNEKFDFFKITVLGDKSQEPLVQELFANQTEEPGCNINPPHSIGGPLNKDFLITNNNQLTIDIQVTNQLDRYYNTWVEISEVSIDWE